MDVEWATREWAKRERHTIQIFLIWLERQTDYERDICAHGMIKIMINSMRK